MEDRNIAFTWFIGTFSAWFAFIMPIQLLLVIIVVAVCFDLVTGYASGLKKNNIKGFLCMLRYFSSNKATKSIVKMILYLCFTIVIFLFEKAILGESIYIVKFTTFLIVFVELKSVCENMDILTGRDVFTTMFKKIRDMFQDRLTDKITDKNDRNKENV
jgi:hypothetical protein